MKLKIVFTTLSIISIHQDFFVVVGAKSVNSEISENNFNPCDEENVENCLHDEGRRRKVGNTGNNIVVVGDGHQSGFGLGDYYVEEEYDGGKGKRGRKKGKKKHKKHLKKMAPYLIGLGGLKVMMYHLLLKKMALFSFLSFILSKISFILASLVALKQFFQQPSHHRSAESNKLEVVHIPIRKLNNKKHKDKDWIDEEESQFIPVTFSPDGVYETTPFPPFYYNFPQTKHEPISFDSDDESFDEQLSDKFSENEIYNEHFKDERPTFDRNDEFTEKNFYKNHVHSPFV